MPSYAASSPGSYSVTVPAYAESVRFTVGAARGGGSYAAGQWYHANGGFGRTGDFRLAVRNYDYTLYFYLGSVGGLGTPGNPGGGGWSPIASGGRGYNAGGGGGGASGVYDGGLNRYTVIVGGGGGAGRMGLSTGTSYVSAGYGIGGGGTSGSISAKSGGNAPAGHRGGGGGGANNGGAGSAGGTTTTNGYAGIGGNSAWYTGGNYYDWTTNSGYANYSNGYYSLSFDIPLPKITYFTSNPSQIVFGGSTELSWSATGNITKTEITPNVGNVSSTGQITVSPTQDTIYTLIVSGTGGSASLQRSIDVLIPPTVNFYSNKTNNTIIQGETATLFWIISGDVATAQLSPGVGLVNIDGTGGYQVSPTQTTTYTIVASHPTAGTGSAEITITVINPPEVTLTGPINVAYGNEVTLSYEGTNVVESFSLIANYVYKDGSITTQSYDLPTSQISNGNVLDTPIYTDRGPIRIDYTLYAVGEGGLTNSDNISVNVIIDETPDFIDIPESDNKLKDQEPVITPDEEVTSQQIFISDIDIPVEIKADQPIRVEIDNNGVWVDVREM